MKVKRVPLPLLQLVEQSRAAKEIPTFEQILNHILYGGFIDKTLSGVCWVGVVESEGFVGTSHHNLRRFKAQLPTVHRGAWSLCS